MQKYTDPTMAMLKRQEVIKEAEQEYEPLSYAPLTARQAMRQMERTGQKYWYRKRS